MAELNLDLFAPENLQTPAPATIYSRILNAAQTREVISEDTCPQNEQKLPNVAELEKLFDRFNWQFFQGRLKRPRIEYSTRLKAAGSWSPSENLIRIGRPYHEIFPDDINDTLKHEMIHLLHMRHNRQFRQEAQRIGTSVRARYHPDLKRPPRFIYACSKCGRNYPRQKRLVMASCGYCSDRGKYDQRYKLKLIYSRKK